MEKRKNDSFIVPLVQLVGIFFFEEKGLHILSILMFLTLRMLNVRKKMIFFFLFKSLITFLFWFSNLCFQK